jgi:HEAT repeat protein
MKNMEYFPDTRFQLGAIKTKLRNLGMAVMAFTFAAALSPARAWQQAPAQNAAAEDPLLEQLKSPDPGHRAKAAQLLGQQGKASAIPALITALTDPSPNVRRQVILALAQFHSAPALDGLVTATRDTDPSVRSVAVRALTGYYTGRIPSIGLKGFLKQNYQRTISPGDEQIQTIAPGAHVDEKSVQALIAALNDTRSIDPARDAARGLGDLLAAPAIPDLIKAAHSSDSGLAREALIALGKIKSPGAGAQLLDLLDSSDRGIKQQAALTLGMLHTEGALPKLQAMYENDPDKSTRLAGLTGLAYLGNPVSLPLFLKALWSANKSYRVQAANGLARARDSKALPDLEKAVKVEKDSGVRVSMDYALASLGQKSYLPDLVQALGSHNNYIAAREDLVELTSRPDMRSELYTQFDNKDANVRRRLCTVLMYTGDSSSIPILEKMAKDKNGDVATAAFRSLSAIRTRTAASS